MKGTSPGDHPGDPVFKEGEGLPAHPAVHGDKIHPLSGVVLHHVQKPVGLHLVQGFGVHHHLVNGHRAEGGRAVGHQVGANRVQGAAGGQVHDGVGAVLQGRGLLGQLQLQADGVGRGAHVGVHLHPDTLADGDGL